MAKDDPGYVYFFLAFDEGDNAGMVKIGFATDPEHRRHDLQTGLPVELSELVVYPGTRGDELAVHRLLKSSRVRGEWFAYSDEVDDFLYDVEDIRTMVEIASGGKLIPTLADCIALMANSPPVMRQTLLPPPAQQVNIGE